MLSLVVLTNEVGITWSESLLVLASNGNTDWLPMSSDVSPLFLSVDDPS